MRVSVVMEKRAMLKGEGTKIDWSGNVGGGSRRVRKLSGERNLRG